ncbi:MAG TPA: 4Fe-4S binding protein [Thermodesulfobacteriota bacterium]|nr:4Fe-4S binding protein [Thermodesulfobacteriota bacterium]
MAVIVDLEKCTGCGTCEEGCPAERHQGGERKGCR